MTMKHVKYEENMGYSIPARPRVLWINPGSPIRRCRRRRAGQRRHQPVERDPGPPAQRLHGARGVVHPTEADAVRVRPGQRPPQLRVLQSESIDLMRAKAQLLVKLFLFFGHRLK